MLKRAFLLTLLVSGMRASTIDEELADITPSRAPSEELRAAAAYREIFNQLAPFDRDKIARFERRYKIHLTDYSGSKDVHNWLLKQFSWDQLLHFYDKLGISYEKAVKTPRLDLLRIKKVSKKKKETHDRKKFHSAPFCRAKTN
jgi:hypothetical protein